MYSKIEIKELTGWGKFPKVSTKELIPKSESEIFEILHENKSFIARGNGRAYGDSAVNKNCTITMTQMNKFLHWNQKSGELIAESGVLIADIIETFLPKGWFPFVTPGTKFITLAGAIACDVHGKNHHKEGSFGNYVNWIEIIDKKNKTIKCSPNENAELFHWTVGGMGLTGIIIRCSINLKRVESGWIKQKNIVNNNLDDTIKSFYNHEDSTYSVAWIDCLASGKSFGRSILMLGEHLKKNELNSSSITFPKSKKKRFSFFFDPPNFLLNNFTVSIFNSLYFNKQKSRDFFCVDWDTFFYPLDSIGNWNRMYGKGGFFQFQCVLPKKHSKKGYTKILKKIQNNASGSFLAVLKNFGPGKGYLSFPQDGLTLALDFKVTSNNISVGTELVNIVNDFGGSIYLAKDAIMNAGNHSKDFNIKEFSKVRHSSICSEQSRRLDI